MTLHIVWHSEEEMKNIGEYSGSSYPQTKVSNSPSKRGCTPHACIPFCYYCF